MGLFDDLIPVGGGGESGVPRITVTPNRAVPAEGRALLDAIAGSEAPGYRTLYGGAEFDGFSDHPRTPVRITSGPNAGKNSTAAGRYQFLAGTWDEVAKEAGLPDFSPESQDVGAWHLADKTYRGRTGRDLLKDLQSARGNPNAVAGIGRMLAGVWTSLPGGIEPNRATSSFASRYDEAAGAPSTDISAQRVQPSVQPAAQARAGLFDDLVPAEKPAAVPAEVGGRFTDAPGESFRTAREGVSEPAPPPTSTVNALGRGAASGLTANFFDELIGLAEAGGRAPGSAEPMTIAQILTGAYRRMSGDPDAVKLYDAAVAREREAAKKAEADQPGASLAGEFAGAVAVPVAAGVKGATMGARALSGARVGAAMGGLAGAGEGTDVESRATGGLVGAGTGAALGAVAPAAVEGTLQAARLAAKPFGAAAQAIRGINDPEAEAARRVVVALQRDNRGVGTPGLTPAEFAANRAVGGPATVMDIGGETTRALARSAANTSPEGRDVLNRAINDRFESQSERVAHWLDRTFGPSDTGATREALQQAARAANRPAYARAYREGDQPLWSDELQRLVGSPDVVDAMRTAAQKGKSRAITDGFGGFNSSVQISPTGVVEFTRGKNGVPTYPNLQFWDYTKRALDDAANAARRAGRNDEASVLGQLATSLRNELDAMVPSYQAARAGAAKFFGAEDALGAGEKFLTSNAPIAEARRAFSQLSPPERALFREGFVQSLVQKIEATGDRRNVLNSIAQSPRAREQIEMVMGAQRAREFETMLRVEGVMDLARSAVQGNSTTARQLTELGLAGGTYGLGTGGNVLDPNPTAIMNAALVWGAARGKGAIDRKVSQRVADLLASNDINQLRKGVQLVARNQSFLDGLRRFDIGIARAGGQQGAGLPPIQSMGTGRAEDDQPQVDRP